MGTRFAKSAFGYFLIWGICTSLTTTICTIVDALLVGNLVGSSGLAVANLSTPVFLFYAMLGVTVGVGANVRIGRFLGSSDLAQANRVFSAQLALGLLIGAVCLLPLTFRDAYFAFLGVTPELYPLAQQYLTVVMWSAPLFVLYHIFSASVRTDSDPKLAAAASAVVIITNLSLDIFFMQVLRWGIVGASASLCIAEGLGVLVLLTHFFKKQALLKLRLALPKPAEIVSFAVNGFGIGSANIFLALVMLVFNTLLLRHGGENGTMYVAIYGVIYTVSMIPFAVFDGASNALSTVTAFFAGESDTDSIWAVLKTAITVAVASGAVLTLVCVLFAGELVAFFGIDDPAALGTAASAFRIFSVSTVFTGVNMVVTSFWQSIGRARMAGAMSILRNFLLMLTVGFVLIPRWDIFGLTMSYVAVEVLCTLLAVAIMVFVSSRKYVEETFGSSGRSFENMYIIQSESMEQISADLEAVCDEWEISMKQAFLINFICEELLLNVIKFSLKESGKTRYIAIKLMEKDGDYVLRIRDNVSVYNPFESDGDEIDNGVLNLIQKKAKYCDYQRKMIFNYLYMIL